MGFLGRHFLATKSICFSFTGFSFPSGLKHSIMQAKYLILLAIGFLCSCASDDSSEYQNIPIDYQVPSNFPPLAYNMANNPLTEKGFELGKKSFTMVAWLQMEWFLVAFVIFKKMRLHITVTPLVTVLATELELEMHHLFKIWPIKPSFFGMELPIISNCYQWRQFQTN